VGEEVPIRDSLNRELEPKKGEGDTQLSKRFWRDEKAQDLIEYSLLLGFVALFSTAIYSSLSGSIGSIWGAASTTVGSALPNNPS
jgi:Flp pilus assembly pilin Flp